MEKQDLRWIMQLKDKTTPFPENFIPKCREQSVYRVSAKYQSFVLLLPGWGIYSSSDERVSCGYK